MVLEAISVWGMVDGLFGELTQGWVDGNSDAAAGAPVEDFA